MRADLFVNHLRAAPNLKERVAHVQYLPAKEAERGALRHGLHPRLDQALRARGLLPLYKHQATAIDLVLDGRDVAVVTPAASGKSLCYNVPVIQALLDDLGSRALYLFPTKALAQDQLWSLQALLPDELRPRVTIFDGDTPHADRAGIRRSGQVVLTNPDMLHIGILPNHPAWSRFLGGLRYIVVDEAHVYRGIFGSHVANVLRRLRRVCARHGAHPRFICSSATVANAGDLAERLTGKPHDVVDEDGAPHGAKHFVFWNPPLVGDERQKRAGAGGEAAQLMEMLLKRDVRTLAFVRTRRQAELVYRNVRDRLRETSVGLAERVRPYRATYLPEDRRAVERGLADGRLLGVVATNALELGIDIGDLDATLLTGYPGSVASTWQQAGRSGRCGAESLSVLIAQDNPLDQFLMRHPEFFFGRPHEHARLRPDNPHVLGPHLAAAAYELPLTPADAALFGPSLKTEVIGLEATGQLRQHGERWYPSPSFGYPARQVNIRSAWGSDYFAVEAGTGRILERVEEFSAFSQLHTGAVYLHQGESYVVEHLDLASHTAYLRQSDAPYYTETRDLTDIRVLSSQASKQIQGATVHVGEVEVSRAIVSFKRKGIYADEDMGEEPLDLPARPFRTVAVWFDLPRDTLRWALRERKDLAGGLHAMEHAAIGVLPLFALCDRNDIGGVSTAMHPDTGGPAVFIYDGHPGGVGIAEHGYEIVDELWAATLATVGECPCADGCPSCIQSPKCGNNNRPLDKEVAIRFLRDLTGGVVPAGG
ncbi:MAG: DEAD/DEAH box helicase [SAR202 cluster bacterium]|nr:DEAD/DEAH box helicase [SAR202 cluster bacterium]